VWRFQAVLLVVRDCADISFPFFFDCLLFAPFLSFADAYHPLFHFGLMGFVPFFSVLCTLVKDSLFAVLLFLPDFLAWTDFSCGFLCGFRACNTLGGAEYLLSAAAGLSHVPPRFPST